MRKIYVCFFIFLIILANITYASNFTEYYEQWKEEHNVTTDRPYQNLTDEEKAQNAQESIDDMFQETTIENLRDAIEVKDEQIEKLNKSESNYKTAIIVINCIYIFIIASILCVFIIKIRNIKKVSK